ncbi:MAG: CBS domain-containing protein [Candidatus Thermoplasmatota archaeon]|nr:CBS domain-containing protein [Candidatus Thermoplasmatota archaeon]
MSTAQDILKKDIVKKDANDTFSQVISAFTTTEAVIVMDHEKYQGMLLKQALMEPTATPHTKLHTLLSHPSRIAQTTTLEEIARIMVENNLYILPVLQNEALLGIVTADDVIKKLTEQHIGSQPVKTIMCTTPVSVSPYETIGKVLHLFRQEHLSYLPVVDHTTIVGTITLDTLLNTLLYTHGKSEGHDNFESQKRQKYDLPVKTIMQEEPVLISPDTAIQDVHAQMHISALPGMLIGKENHLHGIVTHKEFLLPYAGVEKEETIAIQFHHRNNTVHGFNKEETVQLLREEFLKNYEKFLEVGYLHVSLEQHKEIKQGLHRVVCEMKLSGKPGAFYATQEGYGPMQAMRNAYQAIEHQINKVKKA